MNVAVVGLGKLGCPMAAVFAQAGHKVSGIDQSDIIVQDVNAGIAPVQEPGLQEIMLGAPFHGFTLDEAEEPLKQADVTFVLVPSPSLEDGTFSTEYVVDAVRMVGAAIRESVDSHIVVIASTVMPGACDTVIRPALEEAAGRPVGESLSLVYSPEFIALGSVIRDMQHPDMVLIGCNEDWAAAKLLAFFRTIVGDAPSAHVLSPLNAEIAKIAVNSYVTMKISFANQLAELCEASDGGNAAQVADAIGDDRRIGHAYLMPGTAFGGPCFPRDNRAFAAAGAAVKVWPDLAVATDRINKRQVKRLVRYALDDKADPVGVLGLSYKPGTHVTEESAGVQLAEDLVAQGKEVWVYDPAVTRENLPDLKVKWVGPGDFSDEKLQLVFIMTAWPEFTEVTFAPKALIADCWHMLDGEQVWHVGEGGQA